MSAPYYMVEVRTDENLPESKHTEKLATARAKIKECIEKDTAGRVLELKEQECVGFGYFSTLVYAEEVKA